MGTGSHRPQWEAAKGRPDVTGGIRHARALRSHTKLKYRNASAESALPKPKEIELPPKAERRVNTAEDGEQSSAKEPPANNSDRGEGSSDSESEGEEDLRLELERLTKRNALRAQRDAPKAAEPKASWRSEALFARKTKNKKPTDDFIDKYVR